MTNPLEDICSLIDYDMKKARYLYVETFGDYRSPAIDDELHRLLFQHQEETVTVPTKLLLALVLRPRRRMGRPPKERLLRRAHYTAVRVASRRWRELGGSKRAKHQAAQEAVGEFRNARIDVETIKAQMRLDPAKLKPVLDKILTGKNR
jgi:hypothetical protein